MPRPRRRMLLDNGMSFNINVLVRAGLKTGACKMRADTHEICAELVVDERHWWGRLRLQHPDFDQTLRLVAVARHFGGRQWYWLCPMTDDRCTVLYRPHGRTMFAGQKYWRQRRMAYRSQFLAPHKRAEIGIRRINAKLSGSEEVDMLYKPKWQRRSTFDRHCARLDKYEEIIEAREQELNVSLLRTLFRLQRLG
jgi:hypothetical protein